MTYIAKAMNKTTRLDAAADRAAGERPSVSNVVPVSSAMPLEYIRSAGEDSGESGGDEARTAAMAVAGLGRRVRPERPVDMAALGTLEMMPPEAVEATSDGAGRSWWREPMVAGGIALAAGALLLGFVFAPGTTGGDDAPPAAPAGRSAAQGGGTVAPGGDGGQEILVETSAATANSGGRPVVVRVQIDGGNSGRVELEGPSAPALAPAELVPTRELPEMPAYFEPLQPLELPPPPVMDPAAEEPIPSRYAAPPIEEEEDSIDDYRLEGIFWDEANPGAIINDKIVEPGKRVGALRVVEIHKDYVTVEFEGRSYDLR